MVINKFIRTCSRSSPKTFENSLSWKGLEAPFSTVASGHKSVITFNHQKLELHTGWENCLQLTTLILCCLNMLTTCVVKQMESKTSHDLKGTSYPVGKAAMWSISLMAKKEGSFWTSSFVRLNEFAVLPFHFDTCYIPACQIYGVNDSNNNAIGSKSWLSLVLWQTRECTPALNTIQQCYLEYKLINDSTVNSWHRPWYPGT